MSAAATGVTAQQFFMLELPRHIAHNLEKFAAQQGTVAFAVRGQGKWTVRMGDLESPVETGMLAGADLRVWFTAPAFADFVLGTLNPARALEDDQIHFNGDPRVLEKLGYLLAPTTSALGARLGS